MKSKSTHSRLLAAAVTSVVALSSSAFAGDVTKADNTNNLDLDISWTSTAPTATDVALWDGAYNTAGSLSAGFTASTPVSWQGIRIGNITGTPGLISIGGTGAAATGSSLTLGSAGVDMSAANQNAVINAATVVLGSSQTWNVGTGRNLRFGTTGTGAANANIDGGAGVVVTVQGGGLVDLNQGIGTNGLAGYAGKWIVGSGTTLRGLRDNSLAFGTNTAADAITLSGGTLAVGGITSSQGNWSWNNNITLTSATNSTISAQNPDATARTLDLTGAIVGSGNLTFSKTQSGAHVFNLKNFGTTTGGVRTNIMGSGDVTINGVTLQLYPAGTGAGLSFTHNNNLKLIGGTLQSFDGIQTFAGNIALEGANSILSNWNGKNVNLNGTIADGGVAGSLTLKAGQSESANTIYVNGHNTYTGDTTLGDNTANKGIVVAKYGDAFGAGTIFIRGSQLQASTAGITIGNAVSVGAGGFRLGGSNNFTLGGIISIDNTSRTIANYGSATITMGAISTIAGSIAAFDNAAGAGSGSKLIVGGNITGAGAAAVSAGSAAFNGINSQIGGTTISGGNVSGTGSFTTAVSMTGGSFLLAGGGTTTSLTTSGGVTFTGTPTVKFASSAVPGAVYDIFTYGAGSVTGGNLLTSAWRGGISDDNLNKKYIFTTGASAARTWNTTTGAWNNVGGNTNFAEGDQKFFDGDSVTFGDIASNSTITLAGNLAPSAVSVTNTANTYTFTGGAITGTTGLAKSGAGALAIASQQSYTGGTTVNGGLLDLTGGGGSSGTIRGSVTVTNGGTLKLSTGDATGFGGGATSLNSINLVDSTLNVNTAANQTLGSATITMTGSSITGIAGSNLDFFANGSALNTLASATTSTISLPTINLRQDNTIFTVANGDAAIDLRISAVIGNGSAGNHTLIKKGAGVMELTQTNAYTGETKVNEGTLVINGNISTSILTTVANGATIAGNATVGALTVEAGGSINPGNSPGTFSTGTLNLAGTYNAEITGLTAGTQYDQIAVTGTVTLSGLLSVTASFTPANGDLFFILTNNDVDVINGTFTGLAEGSTVTDNLFNQYTITYLADAGTASFEGGNDVALKAIPEPASILLGSLGLLALLRRRR